MKGWTYGPSTVGFVAVQVDDEVDDEVDEVDDEVDNSRAGPMD